MKLTIFQINERYGAEKDFIAAPNCLVAEALYRNKHMLGSNYSVNTFPVGEIEISESALEKLVAPEQIGMTEPHALKFPSRKEFIPRRESNASMSDDMAVNLSDF